MKSVATRNSKKPASPMRILLIWTLVSGLLFGLAEFGEPIEDLLLAIRNKAHEHDASGQVVVVGIDNLAQQEVGDWPWKADRYARMIENLGNAGARRIFFDFPIKGLTSDPGAPQFVEALKKNDGRVYLVAAFTEADGSGKRIPLIPPPEARRYSHLVSTNVWINGYNIVWSGRYANRVGDLVVPSIASVISGLGRGDGEEFPIDYSIAMNSLPYVSAGDILRGGAALSRVRGRDVIIGTNANGAGNRYSVPAMVPPPVSSSRRWQQKP